MIDRVPEVLQCLTIDIQMVLQASAEHSMERAFAFLRLTVWGALICCLVRIAVQDARTRLIPRRQLGWTSLYSVILPVSYSVYMRDLPVCTWEFLDVFSCNHNLLQTSLLWSIITVGYLLAVRAIGACLARLRMRLSHGNLLHCSSEQTLSNQAVLLGGGDLWLLGLLALLLQGWTIALVAISAALAVFVRGSLSVLTHAQRFGDRGPHQQTSRFFEPFAFAPYITASFLLVTGVVLLL